MNISLNNKERAVIGAALYLLFLFVAIIALGWLVLIGGNPITVKNIGVVSATGYPNDKFHAGDIAGIKRQVCSDQTITVEFFPAIRDSRGVLFPLPGGMVELSSGCHETTYGFVVPDLPFGEYTYINAVRFQNNLVGRDETAIYPPVRVRIMR